MIQNSYDEIFDLSEKARKLLNFYDKEENEDIECYSNDILILEMLANINKKYKNNHHYNNTENDSDKITNFLQPLFNNTIINTNIHSPQEFEYICDKLHINDFYYDYDTNTLEIGLEIGD